MNATIKIAATETEREAIYRLRYEVYVEEMQIFGDVADHTRRMFRGPNDADARLMYATIDGETIATMRLNLGTDAPFSQEFDATYHLDLFRPAITDEQVMIFTRFMVKQEYRGTPVAFLMLCEAARISLREGIEVALCDCQPHLIRYYNRIGFRSYDCPVYNDPEFDIMVPMAFILGDVEYLKNNRSPVYPIFEQEPTNAETGRRVAELLGRAAVQRLEDAEPAESKIYDVSFFEGLKEEDAKAVASRGYVFDVAPDDRIIRQGQTARTVFVVLSGSLEVCNEDGLCTEAQPGDVVGEPAFLLSTRRIADVYAGAEGARVLSLDEGRLQRLVNKPSRLAAMLLLNLSKVLARKMAAIRIASPSSASAMSMAA